MSSKNGKRTTRAAKKAKPPRQQARPARQAAPATPAGEIALAVSDATKTRALAAYREAGTVTAACAEAGIGRRTWYDWLESDPAFGQAVMSAHEDVSDDLEKEAIRRAKAGSDTLIIFLLKSRRRAQYGDRQTLEVVSPDVQQRLQRQVNVIASREAWTSADLLTALDAVWGT